MFSSILIQYELIFKKIIDMTLMDTAAPDPNGPVSYSNERVLHTPEL